MPKVISRSAISSSTDAQPTASSAAALRVYYCLCGEFVLVIDKSLSLLPTRKTDGAIIIRSKDQGDQRARVFKLNAQASDPVLVERQGGHEKEYRWRCSRCMLLIGYQSVPPPVKNAPFLYVLKGALTEAQGQIPYDAFEGEELQADQQTGSS